MEEKRTYLVIFEGKNDTKYWVSEELEDAYKKAADLSKERLREHEEYYEARDPEEAMDLLWESTGGLECVRVREVPVL